MNRFRRGKSERKMTMEVEARKQVEEGKMASEVEPETKPSW